MDKMPFKNLQLTSEQSEGADLTLQISSLESNGIFPTTLSECFEPPFVVEGTIQYPVPEASFFTSSFVPTTDPSFVPEEVMCNGPLTSNDEKPSHFQSNFEFDFGDKGNTGSHLENCLDFALGAPSNASSAQNLEGISDDILLLPPAEFDALLKQNPNLSCEEVAELRRRRRRALNRGYQQRTRTARATQLHVASQSLQRFHSFISSVRALAAHHLRSCPKEASAFLSDLDVLQVQLLNTHLDSSTQESPAGRPRPGGRIRPRSSPMSHR